MITDQIYHVLKSKGPLSIHELVEILSSTLKRDQIRNGLERLRKHEKILNCENKWEILPEPTGKTARPRLYITQDELEEVESKCNGQSLHELRNLFIDIDPHRVQQIVCRLRDANRVRYTDMGWVQVGDDDDNGPDCLTRKDRRVIDAEDLAWMDYWSPANRMNRKQETWIDRS